MLAPEGPQICVPAEFFADLVRRLFDGVGLPDLLAGQGVQRDHASARGTAFVLRIHGRALFGGRQRHVHARVVIHRRAGDSGVR